MSFAPAQNQPPLSPAAAVLAAMSPTPPPQPVDDTEARAMEIATEMRANAVPRGEIVSQLAALRVSETTADYLINQADLFAGMMGRPHPLDIDPQIRTRIDKDGPMMMVASAETPQHGPTPGSKTAIVEQARSLAAQGYPVEHVIEFLGEQGAPPDQASRIGHELMGEVQTAKGQKSRRKSRFRRG